MSNCGFAIANILITTVTAAIEYNTAPTEKEGIKRIGERIKKNKTVESTVDCVFNDNSDCECKLY